MLGRTRLIVVSAAAVALGLSGQAAFGQTSTPPATPGKDDPALKGPAVPERAAGKRKQNAGFGPDSIERKKAGGNRPTPPLSMTDFLKSLIVLQSSSTPAAARLTEEQQTKIKALAAAFETESKSYMDKNKQELETLRSQLSANDRAMLDQQLARGGPIRLSKAGFGGKKNVLKHKAGEKAGGPSPSAGAPARAQSDEAAKVRARIVEIYAGRPKADDAQAKILGVLTGDQLSRVQDELAKLEPQRGKHRSGHGKGRPAKA